MGRQAHQILTVLLAGALRSFRSLCRHFTNFLMHKNVFLDPAAVRIMTQVKGNANNAAHGAFDS